MSTSYKQVDDDYTEYQYQTEKAALLSALIDGLYADDECMKVIKMHHDDTCDRINTLQDRIDGYQRMEQDTLDKFNAWQGCRQ